MGGKRIKSLNLNERLSIGESPLWILLFVLTGAVLITSAVVGVVLNLALIFGVAAAKYIDAFMQNVNWEEVNRRIESVMKA